MSSSSSFSVKTCIIGSQGVGKTSMIHQLNTRQFKSNVTPTIGACFTCKVIDVDSYTVRFQMWDTAGQETYKSMLPMYYRKANLAMAVYDITCYDSFRSLPRWIEELKKNADRDCLICVIGNKCDLERVVDRTRATQFAVSIGALYFETSARTSEGIMDAFICVARQLINVHQRRRLSMTSSADRLNLEEEPAQPPSNGCCSSS